MRLAIILLAATTALAQERGIVSIVSPATLPTPGGVLDILRSADAEFLDSFTLRCNVVYPEDVPAGSAGRTLRQLTVTGSADGPVATDCQLIRVTDKDATIQSARAYAREAGSSSGTIQLKTRELTLREQDFVGSLVGIQTVTINDDGTATPSLRAPGVFYTLQKDVPGPERPLRSTEEFRAVLSAGRGYSRLLDAVATVEKRDDGLLEVEADGRAYNQACKWRLTIDPQLNYLVRSATAWRPDNGFEYFSIENRSTLDKGSTVLPETATYVEARFPAKDFEETKAFEVSFVEYVAAASMDIIALARQDLRDAIPAGTEVYDYTKGDGDTPEKPYTVGKNGDETEAGAVTKEQVIDAYLEKFRHLGTFRIQYTKEMRYNDGENPIALTSFVELCALGAKRAFSRTDYDPIDDVASLSYRQVHDGHIVKRVNYAESGERHEGEASYLTPRMAVSFGSTTLLGYAGLYPIDPQWDGKRETMVSGSKSCDMTVLMRHPESRILPDTVDVHGQVCFVVEVGEGPSLQSRWWLGRDLGFAVVKREGYTTLLGQKQLRLKVQFDQFREVAPGFFLPNMMRLEYYDVVGVPGSQKVDLTNQIVHTLTSFSLVPGLTDSDFELDFTKDTRVHDKAIGTFYIAGELPDGFTDLLTAEADLYGESVEKAVETGQVEGVSPLITSRGTTNRRSRAIRLWLFIGLLAIIALVATAGIAVFRRRWSPSAWQGNS